LCRSDPLEALVNCVGLTPWRLCKENKRVLEKELEWFEKRCQGGNHREGQSCTEYSADGVEKAHAGYPIQWLRKDKPMTSHNHMILHVPHDSTYIPEEERGRYLLTETELAEEVRRMTDHRTYALVEGALPPEQVIRAGVSRLVVDVERFIEDDREPMSKKGMGVIYEKTSDGRPLRRELTKQERQDLLQAWYFPHHRRLADAVESVLERSGKALIIDIHSYPGVPLAYELSKDAYRPEICIGTDEYHTPTLVAERALEIFQSLGCDTALNTPFSGTIVPEKHYRKDPRVSSLMIEIRRDKYMDERACKRGTNFFKTRGKLLRALEELGDMKVSCSELL